MKTYVVAVCMVILFNCCLAADAAQSILSQEDVIKLKKRYHELYPDADKKDITKPLAGRKEATKQELDKMKQVVADLKATIEKNAKNKTWCAMLQNQIADTYMAMGEYSAAIAEYKKALELYPDQKNMRDSAQSSLKECEKLMSGEQKDKVPENADKTAAVQTQPAVGEPAAVEPPQSKGPVGEEYIFEFKNGKKIKGEIVKETKDSFTIRFSGNTIVFEKSEIATYRKAE